MNPQTSPLAMRILADGTANRQAQSLFFSRLPPEIRVQIYSYALLRYNDPMRPYQRKQRYCRPGREGADLVAVQLLHTCRAVYVEAATLPVSLNPLIVYESYDKLDMPPNAKRDASGFVFLAPWQKSWVNALDITVQQGKLEQQVVRDYAHLLGQGLFEPTCRITKLTLRLHRTDFWSWSSASDAEPEDRLALDPQLGSGRLSQRPRQTCMIQAAEHRRGSEYQLPNPESLNLYGDPWGDQISQFKFLKTLEMHFEFFRAKCAQLETLVSCARTWVFPMQDGWELVHDGDVEVSSWPGCGDYNYNNALLPWHPAYSITREFIGGSQLSVSRVTRRTLHTELIRSSYEEDFEVRVVRWVQQRAV